MKKAAVILDDGFEELEAMGPIALLRRGGVEVDLVAANNKDSVTGRFGVNYSPATPMKDYDFDSIDALILPGGPQYQKFEQNEDLKKIIRKVSDDDDKILAAICASPTVLGHMGLLKGKDYTCFLSMNEDFGGTLDDGCYVVTDGNLITGRSAAASIDFAFAILEALTGAKHAEEVKRSIYY